MTEEQKQAYKELYRLVTNINSTLSSMDHYYLLLKLLDDKKYDKVYALIPDAKEELNNYIEKLTAISTQLSVVQQSGKPLKDIIMNKAVQCSYTAPQDGMMCASCAHACSIQLEEEHEGEMVTSEYILCNICDQAYNAYEEGYTKEQLNTVFGVHPEGRCKFQLSIGEDESVISLDDYVEQKSPKEEPVEIPPETEGGYVEEEDMEHP